MARAELAAARGDWVDRLYDVAPLPSWLVGVAIGLLLAAPLFGLTTLTGELDAFLARGDSVLANRDARLGLVLPLFAAYVLTAQRYLADASRRHLAWLRRETGAGGVPRAPARATAWILGFACLMPPAVALLIDRDPLLYFRPGYWSGASVANWLVGVVASGAVGRFAHATLEWSRAFSREAERLPEVDLFDRRWLTPFASQGLFCALLWLVAAALFTVNLGDEAFFLVLIPMTLLCGALGGLALWLPTVGVHRRLVAARDAELERVRRALRGDRSAARALAVSGGSREPGLGDLLAYARFLEELPTTPLRLASWLRLALYVALPLGSWLGGALVERAIATLLD